MVKRNPYSFVMYVLRDMFQVTRWRRSKALPSTLETPGLILSMGELTDELLTWPHLRKHVEPSTSQWCQRQQQSSASNPKAKTLDIEQKKIVEIYPVE
ncbi:hypothetical protein EVAR_940_1 [Eumeta japonica]|uniref:Uncharacterized protein n=1 Tax=Eumeta variegata TaxID=151549 RepID=A0A4C1SEA6_EUMVA|nr:hypothetical protein EVAR_940_1 [Eumeta japonica]